MHCPLHFPPPPLRCIALLPLSPWFPLSLFPPSSPLPSHRLPFSPVPLKKHLHMTHPPNPSQSKLSELVEFGSVNIDDETGMQFAEKLGVLEQGIPNVRVFTDIGTVGTSIMTGEGEEKQGGGSPVKDGGGQIPGRRCLAEGNGRRGKGGGGGGGGNF
jgi:hypothetical protein